EALPQASASDLLCRRHSGHRKRCCGLPYIQAPACRRGASEGSTGLARKNEKDAKNGHYRLLRAHRERPASRRAAQCAYEFASIHFSHHPAIPEIVMVWTGALE